MDALARVDSQADLPTSFVSEAFAFWKKWKKRREYWVTLKSGMEIAIDISDAACKGYFITLRLFNFQNLALNTVT